jgi:response regulator RpfG family c-di-GMP phosphodiesterase
MTYDPMIANARPKDLVRMVEMDSDATQRELKMAEILRRSEDDREDFEGRAESAEEELYRSQSELEGAEETIDDLQSLIRKVIEEVDEIPADLLEKLKEAS